MSLTAEPHRAGEGKQGGVDPGGAERRPQSTRRLRRGRMYWLPFVLLCILGAYLSSGFYIVGSR